MTHPHYTHDGYPQNLEAASADSLEWLLLLRKNFNRFSTRKADWERLDQCIAALESFLPEREPVYADSDATAQAGDDDMPLFAGALDREVT